MIQPLFRPIAVRAAAAALALGTVAGGVGVAHAAALATPAAQTATTATSTSTSTSLTTAASAHAHSHGRLLKLHRRITHAERKALRQSLDLTPAQLRADRQKGESVAAIAQAANVPLATVTTAMDNAAQAVLQQAVNAGHLKASREQTLLARIEAAIQKRVNATPRLKATTTSASSSTAPQS